MDEEKLDRENLCAFYVELKNIIGDSTINLTF